MTELPETRTATSQSVQQLLEIAQITVREQTDLVIAGDPRRVVERRAEHSGRWPPGVEPGDRADRGPYIGAGRRLHRMTGQRRRAAGIRSITSVQFSGSAAISRGTRTGGRCRTNER